RACFFFRAEDGIRDRNVTGVQTCALPISGSFLGFGSRKVCLLSPPQSAGRGASILHGPSSEAPSGSAQAPSGSLPSPPVSLSLSLLPSVSASDFDDAVDEPSSAVMPESFPDRKSTR